MTTLTKQKEKMMRVIHRQKQMTISKVQPDKLKFKTHFKLLLLKAETQRQGTKKLVRRKKVS
jgi:hypothetical protein